MPTPGLRDALKRALLPLPRSPERGGASPARAHADLSPRPIVVLGVGSELLSDDAAGLRLADLLDFTPIPNVHAVAAGPAPENATAEIRRLAPSHLIIVDAADLGEAPGSVRVVPREAIQASSFGTHGLPLSVLADYLEAEVGCRVCFIGIQPASLAFGESLSEEVSAAVLETVEALRQCLPLQPSSAPEAAS